MTALGATRPTFITIWPTGEAQPEASNLNPLPGDGPVPNAVLTDIDATGRFDVYNLQGTVDVIIDVNGYYADHHNDDRYYTKAQTDARIGAGDDAQKFIPNNIYADPGLNFDERFAGGDNAGVGGANTDIDLNLTLPPDFTTGSPLTVRLLAYARDTSTFPCNGELSNNWTFVNRADVGSVPTTLLPNDILYVFTVPEVSKEYVVTLDAEAGLAAGDAVSFGLFGFGPATRCSLVVTGVAAYYD